MTSGAIAQGKGTWSCGKFGDSGYPVIAVASVEKDIRKREKGTPIRTILGRLFVATIKERRVAFQTLMRKMTIEDTANEKKARPKGIRTRNLMIQAHQELCWSPKRDRTIRYRSAFRITKTVNGMMRSRREASEEVPFRQESRRVIRTPTESC